MNFCVVPREIREINKRGRQNKLRGVSENHEKINVPLVCFEPESATHVLFMNEGVQVR